MPCADALRVSLAQVDFEGELAVVIGRDCKNVSTDEALDYVLGYTIANDVTARRWQGRKGGGQWCRGKAFDTFCPLGPGVVPANRLNPDNLRITTRLNGEVMQESSTADMVRWWPLPRELPREPRHASHSRAV